MSRRYVYDNRVAGVLSALGAVAMAVGACLPMLRASGPTASLSKGGFGFGVALTDTVGGLEDGGVFLLLAAVVAGLLAVVLMWTRRGWSWIARIVQLLLALAVGVFALGVIAFPVELYVAWLMNFQDGEAQRVVVGLVEKLPGVGVTPAAGAYLTLAGAGALVLGSVTPGRRALRDDELRSVAQPGATGAPPGWYPTRDGSCYWDGYQCTEDLRP